MAKRKTKPADLTTGRAGASVARVRVAPKKRSTARKRAAKNGSRIKRAAGKQPPQKRFDAMKWCGILPELAGDSLALQRQMRDEW